MDIGPLCDAAKPLGHSWPGPHWWMTLSASDQGAWVSGIGTIFAGVAALVVAFLPRYWRWIDTRAQASLIAKLIVDELDLARSVSFALARGLSPFRGTGELVRAAEVIEDVRFYPTPMIDRFLEKLDLFDHRSFPLIAAGVLGIKNCQARLDLMREVSQDAAIREGLHPHGRKSAIESVSVAVGEAAVALDEALAACGRYGAVPLKTKR